MKLKILLPLILLLVLFTTGKVNAQTTPTPTPPYQVCKGQSGCPVVDPAAGYTCAASYTDWETNKAQNFWVNDPEVTALGRGGERARQFLLWTITHRSIDNSLNILSTWSLSRDLSYFFFVVVAALMGLGLIIARRYNFGIKTEVTPLIIKIIMALLYITFSATIVLLIIQISDTLMLFFIERLGVKQLFNIFFCPPLPGETVLSTSERCYQTFQGCSNLNVNLLDSVRTSKFLVKITNMSYYMIGIMMILRKIILWLLLITSPFLALLMQFILIRNTGWIWIGVFFQWVFYGPLFALFLGGLAAIWNSPQHIPFNFDFSRTHNVAGFVYPTVINILYGGPAQRLDILNSSNYVDTFAEYIIALLMLWAVTFFPWWLLRIFRDYCCEGIIAAKNILLSMYDQMRNPPPPPPSPIAPVPTGVGTTSTALQMPRDVESVSRVKLDSIEDIRRSKTEDITKSLNLSMTKLTDIAHYETNKQTKENVVKNLNFLQNPVSAETPVERQKYMNIRTELFSRAIKEDRVAKQILSSVSTSRIEQMEKREEMLKTVPAAVPVTHIVSVKVNLPQQQVKNVTSSVVNSTLTNTNLVNQIAQTSNVESREVQTILSSYVEHLDKPAHTVIDSVVKQTGMDKQKVTKVIKNMGTSIKTNKEVVTEVAQKQNVRAEEVQKVIDSQVTAASEPDKHVEENISVPPVSIEEYEEVKKLWENQYEKGEVPVAPNIKNRNEWVDQDIVFITNTLNKLLSPNKEMRLEGLDDVGYILPVFLINNMKGEELVVYLKAKLEAAKQIQEALEKVEEAKEAVKKEAADTEELVEVTSGKSKEAEKTMEMKEEMKEPEKENKPV